LPRRRGRNLLPPDVLDRFKYEVAEELGLRDEIETKGWADMPTRSCGVIGGHIGGNMVRVMIRYAEDTLGRGGSLE